MKKFLLLCFAFWSLSSFAIASVPHITLTNGAGYTPPPVTLNSDNNPIGRFNLTLSFETADLSSVTITFAGTEANITWVKLWSSTSSTYDGTATQIGTTQSYGSTVTFGGLTSSVSTGSGTYYYVTLDLGSSSGSVSATIAASSDISGTVGFFPTPGNNQPLSSGSIELPVELTSFTSSVSNFTTILAWKTATEVNNAGFDVERKSVNNHQSTINSWAKIGFVAGHGTTNAPQQYSFTDNVGSAGTYSYRLKQVDHDGAFTYSQAVEVKIGAAPNVFALGQNYPNPFNPSTNIQFTVPSDGRSVLKVYNTLG